ncbi:hypothetical protein SAMN05446935_0327 [Burkholderia sp. YR290]|nr:hypothetical protein SAMN05446935_0327 [Burkholderia sp. YR290]
MASSPNITLNITANVAGQAQVQALSQALAQLRTAASAASGSGSGNPFAGITAGAAGASASVGDLADSIVGSAASMAAGFLSAKAAAEGFFDAFHRGIEYNADTEKATLGIETLINALYTARDATGALVSGPAQLQMSAEEATKQLTLLRQASLETAATGEQLQETFVRALAAGASAGLTIDQIRQLTVLISQAAGAMGLPLSTLNRDIRDLLNGSASTNTVLQRMLGITGAQVQQWRQQGTLAENLTAKLQAYAATGAQAATTWSAALQHVGDTFSMVLGQMTKGSFEQLKNTINGALTEAFDPKTLGVTESFSEIEKLGETVFGGLGHLLSEGIQGAVEGAKEFNDWLAKNADTVTSLQLTFGYIVDLVLSIAKTIATSGVDLVQWGVESGTFQTSLNGVAVILAMIQDGFQLIKMYIAEAGAALEDAFGAPLKNALARVAEVQLGTGVVGDKIAGIAAALSNAIPTSGNGLRATAREIADNFAAGNTAVAKIQAQLKNGLATQKANDAENQRLKSKQKDPSTGGSLTPKPEPSDGKEAAKVQKAEEDLAKANAQAIKAVQTAALAEQQTELDQKLQLQLISYQDYYRAKAALQQGALDQEQAALEAEKQSILARQTADEAASIKKQADLVKVQGQLDALAQKRHQVSIQVEIDTTKARRELQEFDKTVDADLLAAQGDAAGSSALKLQIDRTKALQDPKITGNPDAQSKVNQTFNLKDQANEITGDETNLQRRNALYKLYDDQLQQQQDAGQLTALEHETLVQAKRADLVSQEEAIVADMEKVAAASNNPDLIAQAAQARLQLEALKKTSDSVSTAINQSFGTAITQGLQDLLSGTKSIGGALRDILLSIVQTWEKIAAQNLSESLIKGLGGNGGGLGSLFSAGSGGLDFGKLFSSFGSLLGFREGGIIDGPGTGTSDSIVARLSKGEGIVNAAAVGYWGEDFIHFLNSAPGYATGGIAGGVTSDRVSAGLAAASKLGPVAGTPAPAQPQSIRIVNSVDPSMMRNSLDSSEGETVIENVLSRNPSRFKNALRIR